MSGELKVGLGRIAILHEESVEDSNIARRLCEGIEPLLSGIDEIDIVKMPCSNSADLFAAFAKLEADIQFSGPPLPVLLFHGDSDSGIKVSETNVSWLECSKYLSRINGRCGNTTIVIAAACFGLSLIEKPNLFLPAPFKVLCAPEERISNSSVEEGVQRFFKCLLIQNDVAAAVNSLRSPFKIFIPELTIKKMIRKSLGSMRGRKGDSAREDAISRVLGMSPVEFDRSYARETWKRSVYNFDDRLLDVIVGRYLCGAPDSFTAEDLN